MLKIIDDVKTYIAPVAKDELKNKAEEPPRFQRNFMQPETTTS